MQCGKEDVVSDHFGVEVIHKDGKYFLKYDGGELAVNMKISEVSKNEAEKSQASPTDAYQTLLACQRREG